MKMAPSATPTKHLDVVFVHGLGSDPTTWKNKKTGFSWPDELNKFEALRVLNVGHFAPLRNIKDTSAVSAQFQATAKGFLDKLTNDLVGSERPIVFVTHSLGGIIVKEALRIAEHNDQYGPILQMTRGIIFLATPHCGSGVANAAAYLAPGIQSLGKLAGAFFHIRLLSLLGIILWGVMELMAGVLRTSSLTSQLKKHDAPLMSLNDWFRNCARVRGLKIDAFYETQLTFRCVHVVDPCSADPGIDGCVPCRAESKDHMSISKPTSPKDDLFITVARIIEGIREESRAGKDYPVFRGELAQALKDTEFKDYAGKGNFSDIPAQNNVRRKFEMLLRTRLRERLKTDPVTPTQERNARSSNYDLDRFLLCFWYERHLEEQLNVLVTFIRQADAAVRANILDTKPPTLFLLYRTVRTLHHILLGRNYTELEEVLTRARDQIYERYKKECDAGKGEDGFDADKGTQDLLENMIKVAITLKSIPRA
jgi:pimeloyl-ACP methyl ester carboxylesterase